MHPFGVGLRRDGLPARLAHVDPVNSFSALTVFGDDRRTVLPSQPAVTPRHHRHEDRIEVIALRREAVLETLGTLLVTDLLKHPLFDEMLEPGREGAPGQSESLVELVEAASTSERFPQDEGSPPVPHDVEGAGDRTGLLRQLCAAHALSVVGSPMELTPWRTPQGQRERTHMTHPQQNRPALLEDSPLSAVVHTSETREISAGGLFSPTTSTLLIGPQSSILIDAQYLPADADAIDALIKESGTTLTHIIITHGHADHFFGIERLLASHPSARAVALPTVAADAQERLGASREQWTSWFDGEALDCTITPEPLTQNAEWPADVPKPDAEEVLESTTIDLDGHAVHVLRVPQADISPTSVVWAPAAGIVVTGDVAYNGVHPMLAYAGGKERHRWLKSLSFVGALDAIAVVAGHKRPGADDSPSALVDTRTYIERFSDLLKTADGTKEMVAQQQEAYPDWTNPTALIGSAAAARKRQKAGGEG